jgi:hypothetical protein
MAISTVASYFVVDVSLASRTAARGAYRASASIFSVAAR